MSFTVRRATSPDDVAQCLALRRAVFIEEQGVPEALEVDGLDGEARHYLALVDGEAAGTARVRLVAPHAKVQRVAVLAAHRRRGIGAALMRALTNDLLAERPAGIEGIALGAQETAVPFYAALGYGVHGEPFMDAGIPHREMRLTL